MERILVIAAHPDDEVLGCGGMIALASRRNAETYALILTDGCTGRYSPAVREELRKHSEEAGRVLGMTGIRFETFPNQALESVMMTGLAQCIEEHIRAISPTAVYTHHFGDLNLDHQIVYRATITACRPLPDQIVRELYTYNVPSSTEWNSAGGSQFVPNYFYDIGGALNEKIEAMRCYRSECREYPHPRSPESLRAHAHYWGMCVGLEYAEPFALIRRVVK